MDALKFHFIPIIIFLTAYVHVQVGIIGNLKEKSKTRLSIHAIEWDVTVKWVSQV